MTADPTAWLASGTLAPLRLRLPTPLRVSTLTAQKLLPTWPDPETLRAGRSRCLLLPRVPTAPLARMRSASAECLYCWQQLMAAPPPATTRPRDPLLGAAARAHPASWSWPCALQLRVNRPQRPWAMGRGLGPAEFQVRGATFRTACAAGAGLPQADAAGIRLIATAAGTSRCSR